MSDLFFLFLIFAVSGNSGKLSFFSSLFFVLPTASYLHHFSLTKYLEQAIATSTLTCKLYFT